MEVMDSSAARTQIPEHVGIIVDGNRRWAKERGLPVAEGHRRGADVAQQCVQWAQDAGVRTLTLWLLSTDNFARSENELDALFDTIANLVRDISLAGFDLTLLGAATVLPDHVHACLSEMIAASPTTQQLHVNVAIGYGGRREIMDAVRAHLSAALAQGETLAEVAQNLSEDHIEQHLYTAGQSAPDLLIRTSGEKRLSGFLLWQCVHSELVFTDVLWPEFTREDLDSALVEFASRERRYGA